MSKFDVAAARRREIERFARHIYVADSDDFERFLIAWHWHNGNTKDDVGALTIAAYRMGRRIIETEATRIIEVADAAPKIRDADKLAAYLGLTYAIRAELGIRTIGACDAGPKIRKRIQRQKRRHREQARRRQQGKKIRAQFLADNSISQMKPWEVRNMSRRSWYYERKRLALVPVSASTRLRLRKQDVAACSDAGCWPVKEGAGTPLDSHFTEVAQVYVPSIKKEDGARTCANGDKGDGARTCATESVGALEQRYSS